MKRTGDALVLLVTVCAAITAGAAPNASITQQVDRTEVGTEDTFRLEVVVKAPDDAELRMPQYEDFEVLSRSQGRQHSIQMLGGGPPVVESTLRVTLILRANRAGQLTLPTPSIEVEGRTIKANSLTMTAKAGSLGRGVAQRPNRIPDPFGGGLNPNDLFEEFNKQLGMDELEIPRGDSDLFLNVVVDKREAYVGEQVTMSLWLFSRVELSSVDSVTLPRLDGFWSEDDQSPTQLRSQEKQVNGIPYRAYLLRKKALFAMKPGQVTIGRAEADITTGFLFAGHRVHRKSQPLTLTVKPLPPGGPKDLPNSQVGEWQLSAQASTEEVTLGEPVTLTLVLSGTGNVRSMQMPQPRLPPGLKSYDPKTSDAVNVRGNAVVGRRTVEYLVMPQKTGEFVLPPIEFPYFNPATEAYETATTSALTFRVTPGTGEADEPVASATGAKNVVEATGLRPLRHRAEFVTGSGELPWKSSLFLAAVGGPAGLWLSILLVGLVRGRLSREVPGDSRKRQTQSARKRLAAAERLAREGSGEAFFGEVEKALCVFLEAQLDAPVSGLTREALSSKLSEAGVEEEKRSRVTSVLEACDLGRFAPGAVTQSREEILEACAQAMEGWRRR